MNGVRDACESCGDEPGGCKRVLGIGAIDHQPKGWRCDGGLHVGSDRRLFDGVLIEIDRSAAHIGMKRKMNLWCEKTRKPLWLIVERRRLIGNRGRQALNPRCRCDPDSGDNDLTGDPDKPD